MENTEQTKDKQPARSKDYAMILFGVLVMSIACLFFFGAIALDATGEKAIGKISNVSANCSGSKTCWTGKMDFTTKSGEQISFYPMTFPIFFDFDPALSGRPYEEYGNYEVRYLEAYPRIAKVKLAFFLEYVNTVCGLCGGVFMLMMAFLFSSFGKSRKPFVIDLSKRK